VNAIFGVLADYVLPFQGLKIGNMSTYTQGDHPVLKYLALSGLPNYSTLNTL